MKDLLKLKHWQLGIFLVVPTALSFGLQFYMQFTLQFNNMFMMHDTQDAEEMLEHVKDMYIGMMAYLPYIIMLSVLGGLVALLWQVAIVQGLQEKLPVELRKGKGLFGISVGIILCTALLTGFGMVFLIAKLPGWIASVPLNDPDALEGFAKDTYAGILPYLVLIPLYFLLFLASFASSIYLYYFAARSIKTAELQQEQRFSDFIGEFFLIWFSFIGIWILQPRLNRLVADQPLTGNEE